MWQELEIWALFRVPFQNVSSTLENFGFRMWRGERNKIIARESFCLLGRIYPHSSKIHGHSFDKKSSACRNILIKIHVRVCGGGGFYCRISQIFFESKVSPKSVQNKRYTHNISNWSANCFLISWCFGKCQPLPEKSPEGYQMFYLFFKTKFLRIFHDYSYTNFLFLKFHVVFTARFLDVFASQFVPQFARIHLNF